jgi:hypothetical protein
MENIFSDKFNDKNDKKDKKKKEEQQFDEQIRHEKESKAGDSSISAEKNQNRDKWADENTELSDSTKELKGLKDFDKEKHINPSKDHYRK